MNMKTHSQGLHKIHKRLDKRQGDPDQDSVCGPVIASESCTNGYAQDLVNVAQQCNNSELAQAFHGACERNSNGIYCAGASVMDFQFQNNFFEICDSINQSCSSDCRNLLISARNQLGCCINFFNDSTTIDQHYAYSLWSGCGVDLVTQECQPSTVNLPPVQLDPTCNETAGPERLHSLFCRKEYVESIRERLSATAGCQDYAYPPGDLCTANRNGSYCVALLNPGNFIAASLSCRNTSTCDPRCIETLNNITSTIGCCLNDHYNTTTRPDWLSYEFWSRCGLDSPGLCEEFLNNDSPLSFNAATFIKASSIDITFAFAIVVMLLSTALIEA